MKKSPTDEAVCSFWAEIHGLAPARFSGFVDPADVDERDAMARYVWNLELCGALYKPLHFLEVGLRNSVHNAIVSTSGRTDWFDSSSILRPEHQRAITEARRQIRQRGVQPTVDRIVAALHFGFWTTLFSSQYEQRIFIPNAAAMFPNMPRRQRTRANVSARLEDARKLRNRVFHHEPIWHFSNLSQRHDRLIETLGFISQPMQITSSIFDDFRSVYSGNWTATRSKLGNILQYAENFRKNDLAQSSD